MRNRKIGLMLKILMLFTVVIFSTLFVKASEIETGQVTIPGKITFEESNQNEVENKKNILRLKKYYLKQVNKLELII